MKKIIVIISIILTFNFLLAAGEASAIFLLISPSPTMNGMGGGIGVCLPSEDPMSGFYNPANGLESFEGVSFSYSKMHTPWLENLWIDDMFFDYGVTTIGINPQKNPFKILISYHKTYLDLGEQTRVDEFGNSLGTFNSNLSANALTAGVGYDGNIFKLPMEVSIGITRKDVEQVLTEFESNNTFYDFGFLISVPYRKSNIFNNYELMVKPSFGYSVSNVGSEVYFNDPKLKDPGPRYARAGIGITSSISYKNKINIIKFQYGLSASDLLPIPRDTINTTIKYQSGFGDIDFFQNVILNKESDLVTVHRGFEIAFLDIFSYRIGKSIDVDGNINLDTKGYGIKTKGIFNLLSVMTESPIFNNLSRYINVQYNYSKYIESQYHPLANTEFHSFSFTLNNVDRLVRKIF